MNNKDYKKDLKERQAEHLKNVYNAPKDNAHPCMHDQCTECVGTGIKHDGGICIHHISCPCSKCTPSC